MSLNQNIEERNALNHVAIIMDGNGRWAKDRGLSRLQGHEEGVQNAREMVKVVKGQGVKYLTLYIFSTENWERPKLEVKALLNLLGLFLNKYAEELINNETRVHVIGKYQEMPEPIVVAFDRLIKDTEHFDEFHLVLAVNYSSRTEIVEAVKQLIKTRYDNNFLDWKDLSDFLYTKDIPDPDLIIRTSGERRLSNFLLLQGAYSEIYFSPVYWPDFKEKHLKEAMDSYYNCERRFGKTSEQLNLNKKLL